MELPYKLTNLLYGIAHQVEIQLETDHKGMFRLFLTCRLVIFDKACTAQE